MSKKDLKDGLTFGFEQTLTIAEWWTEPGFTSTSDTPLKREKMLDLARELAQELGGKYFESKDIWDHMQYEVTDSKDITQFYVTMDPGSIELKTPPCLIHDIQNMATPIFKAAERANVVAYRNWWYGVKGGTEGGCHVNMGGFTDETNPLKAEPELVVKYSAYVHNRPWLHYPFMGIDIGPGGNAMRMDEKDKFSEVKEAFERYKELYQKGETLGPQATYDFFKDTNLIAEKASYPSLYKFKEGLFLIEDRGQEALRSAEDFFLVANLRLKILEHLQKEKLPESLESFKDLHTELLTSFSLWEKFESWAHQEVDLDPAPFKRFFERQFPELTGGNNPPKSFSIRDGRRPRVITDIQKRGDVIVSKTVDTTYKRFEIITHLSADHSFKITAQGIEKISEIREFKNEGKRVQYIDIKYDRDSPLLEISLIKEETEIETATFNINDMMWT